MDNAAAEFDDIYGVGRRGNSYGFDHSRPEHAPQQLQVLMQMQNQPNRFATINNYIKRMSKKRLDPSRTGVGQIENLKIIGDQLKNEFPRDFGPVAPKNNARLYYAIRCALKFHRENRATYARILKREVENDLPVPLRDPVVSWKGSQTLLLPLDDLLCQRKKKAKNQDIEEIPRPALAELKRNSGGTRQTTIRERMAQNLATTRLMQQDMFPCTDPFQPAPTGVIAVDRPRNTQAIRAKHREVIIVDDSDDDDITVVNLPQPTHDLPAPNPQVITTSPSRSCAERPNVPQAPNPLLNSVSAATTTTSPVHIKAEPSSPTLTNSSCPPSPSQDESINIPAIHNFLQNYCSPPMTEFLARFVHNGVRNTTRLDSIAAWSPYQRLELFRDLPSSPGGFPITYVDVLALQRAFGRLHEENLKGTD